ncbi:MAG: histidinol-phosphate transaminase [Clostridium sp.]|nr:histidinol-phosphate transaminase [Clostridium sp.]
MNIKKYIEELEEYVPGFQPDLEDPEVIKLNANENPYPPSPLVNEAIRNMNVEKFRIYPQAQSIFLREAIAKVYNTDVSEVFCGNGSDEVISLIVKTFLEEGGNIVTPYPTYTVYKVSAAMEGISCTFVDVDENYEIDVKKLLDVKSDAIFLVNPNAPTGVLLSTEKIRYILDNYDGLVVIDEAYMEFCDEDATMIKYINDYSNLIVMRTMSKSYSLCGARVGFCFANRKLIGYLDKCRDSYNINYVSQIVGIASVKDQKYHLETIEKIKNDRKYLGEKLKELGFEIIPSNTNFILCTPKRKSAAEIVKELEKYKIYIRYFNSPRLDDKLRITVGTKEEIDKLINALKEIL